MSGQIRYSDEFKVDAVAQVTERGYSVKAENGGAKLDHGSAVVLAVRAA